MCSIACVLLTKTRYPLWLNGFNMNGVQEAAGSNPVTRTKEHLLVKASALYFFQCVLGTGIFLRRRSRKTRRWMVPARAAIPAVRIRSLGSVFGSIILLRMLSDKQGQGAKVLSLFCWPFHCILSVRAYNKSNCGSK